jgi:hypothetical protein
MMFIESRYQDAKECALAFKLHFRMGKEILLLIFCQQADF